MVKTPPKKVFWGGFKVISTFSGGVWTLRDCNKTMEFDSCTAATAQLAKRSEEPVLLERR